MKSLLWKDWVLWVGMSSRSIALVLLCFLSFFKPAPDLFAWGRSRPSNCNSLRKCEDHYIAQLQGVLFIWDKSSHLNYPADYMYNHGKYDAISTTQTLPKNRIVTSHCRRLAISEVVHYFNRVMCLNLNIFTKLQMIWLLHKIGRKQSLRV